MVCWSRLTPASETWFYISRPNSTFSDVKFVAWNWPSGYIFTIKIIHSSFPPPRSQFTSTPVELCGALPRFIIWPFQLVPSLRTEAEKRHVIGERDYEGSLVLLLRLVTIPGWEPLSSWPPHLEALLSSLCALFIPLPLPAKICTHCLTFTQLSRITRPSLIFFHSPKQHQYQGQKRNHLELQNQTFSPSSSCLTWSPRAPKAQVYLLHSSPSSPSSPHPAERFCKPIWKFLIWNLYSRLSSMCIFAYPECSSYCLLNQRAVNQSDPQQ